MGFYLFYGFVLLFNDIEDLYKLIEQKEKLFIILGKILNC